MQNKLLDIPKDWEEQWQGMPEYIQKDLTSFSSLIVHFRDKKDRDTFAKLVNQKITHKTKTIWFPEVEMFHADNYVYRDKSKTTKPTSKKGEK